MHSLHGLKSILAFLIKSPILVITNSSGRVSDDSLSWQFATHVFGNQRKHCATKMITVTIKWTSSQLLIQNFKIIVMWSSTQHFHLLHKNISPVSSYKDDSKSICNFSHKIKFSMEDYRCFTFWHKSLCFSICFVQ